MSNANASFPAAQRKQSPLWHFCKKQQAAPHRVRAEEQNEKRQRPVKQHLSPKRRDSAQETQKARQMKSSGSQAQNQDRSLLALRGRSLRRKLRGGGAVHLLGPRRAQRARSPSGKPLGSTQSLLERAYGSQGYEKFRSGEPATPS